jgi:hypothetical protein
MSSLGLLIFWHTRGNAAQQFTLCFQWLLGFRDCVLGLGLMFRQAIQLFMHFVLFWYRVWEGSVNLPRTANQGCEF